MDLEPQQLKSPAPPSQENPASKQSIGSWKSLIKLWQQIHRKSEAIAPTLRNLPFFKLVEVIALAIATSSILYGVMLYGKESSQRQKVAQYQAWQTIDTVQGQGGSGGRIQALQDLNKDSVSLAGLIADKAYLREINLEKADLKAASLQGANLEFANLQRANLNQANLQKADLRIANLQAARLQEAKLQGANFHSASLQAAILLEANLSGAILNRTNLENAYLQGANLQGADLEFANLKDANLKDANLQGALNLSPDRVKRAQNWEKAKYDQDFRKQLGLSTQQQPNPQPQQKPKKAKNK